MSEENQVAGGDNPNTGGETGQVSYETYDKTVKQVKSFKEKLTETNELLKAYQEKELEIEQQKLEQEGKLKEVIEYKDKKIEELMSKVQESESKVGHLEKTFEEATKLDAVVNKLPGNFKRKEYMSFIDTSKIMVDPETGALDATSVEAVANEFVKEHGTSLLNIRKGTTPPADAANTSSTRLTLEQWKQLPLKERKARMGEVYNTINKE